MTASRPQLLLRLALTGLLIYLAAWAGYRWALVVVLTLNALANEAAALVVARLDNTADRLLRERRQ